MGRSTSVKEKITFSGAERSCACRPGSMVCAYFLSGGNGAIAICRAPGVNDCTGCCAWGASGNAEPSIGRDNPVDVCVIPTLATTSEKSRRRPQMQKELVKAPLRFQNSFLSSLCERK